MCIITSLSSLTMSGPSVYSPLFLSLSPCGLFSALRLLSLYISLLPPLPYMTSAPLNKSIFPSCCSCVFSWGFLLLSFPPINKEPHRMSPYRFLLHQSVLSSAQISQVIYNNRYNKVCPASLATKTQLLNFSPLCTRA